MVQAIDLVSDLREKHVCIALRYECFYIATLFFVFYCFSSTAPRGPLPQYRFCLSCSRLLFSACFSFHQGASSHEGAIHQSVGIVKPLFLFSNSSSFVQLGIVHKIHLCTLDCLHKCMIVV
jgi:hypothetical protein